MYTPPPFYLEPKNIRNYQKYSNRWTLALPGWHMTYQWLYMQCFSTPRNHSWHKHHLCFLHCAQIYTVHYYTSCLIQLFQYLFWRRSLMSIWNFMNNLHLQSCLWSLCPGLPSAFGVHTATQWPFPPKQACQVANTLMSLRPLLEPDKPPTLTPKPPPPFVESGSMEVPFSD